MRLGSRVQIRWRAAQTAGPSSLAQRPMDAPLEWVTATGGWLALGDGEREKPAASLALLPRRPGGHIECHARSSAFGTPTIDGLGRLIHERDTPGIRATHPGLRRWRGSAEHPGADRQGTRALDRGGMSRLHKRPAAGKWSVAAIL